MAVRSKRLFGPTSVSTGSTLVYTCPAGETALLKHLSIANLAALGNTWSLRLNGTGGAQTIAAGTVPAGEAVQLTGLFVVMHPGDTLRCTAGQASVALTAFGAELEGVAD